MQGPPGFDGIKGEAGASCREQQQYYSGTLVVRHSQSTIVPQCQAGHYRLWEGYSLLYVEGNEKAHHQDLGELRFQEKKILFPICVSITTNFIILVNLSYRYKSLNTKHMSSQNFYSISWQLWVIKIELESPSLAKSLPIKQIT